MKLRILTLLALFSAFCAQAEVLTPAQALSRAAENLPANIAPARRAAALRNAEPLLTIGSEKPEVYLFGSAAGGLVVASAESETTPLLGYSEQYAEGEELPPSMKWLLSFYGQEIRALRSGDVVKRPIRRASQTDFAPIAEICRTRWNQAKPYYYDCPVLDNYYCYTGCVATAMAQVLKTYEYPAKCSGGTFSYQWKNGNKTLSKNFNNVTLDWANMLNTYSANPSSTAASSKAVANLMSAVGYASQMDYGTDGSGTQGIYCAEGIVRNFDYDYTLQYLYMDWFDLADWQKKVYDELAAGHPVYYDGVNLEEKTGHAFVIDGYQANGYFHLNWGWGGSDNGYFLLTALDPGEDQGIGGSTGGYSAEAGAIFNMSPGQTMTSAEAPLTIYSSKPLVVPSSAKKLGAAISDNVGVYSYSPYEVPEAWIALKFTRSSGEYYYSSVVEALNEVQPGYGVSGTANFYIPEDLPEGEYTITRVVYNPTSKKVFDLYYDRGVTSKISATVSGTTMTFSKYVEPIAEEMYFSDVTVPSVIYYDEEFSISSNFVNATKQDYTGRLYVKFCPKGSSEAVLTLQTGVITLESMSYGAFNPKAVITREDLDPGEYTLLLACDDESVVSEPQSVTIAMRPAVVQGSNFECTSQHINNIWFDIDLTALNSDYSGTVALVIAKNKTSPILWSDKFDLNLAAGETTTKSYSEIDLTDKARVDESYIIYGIYVNEEGVSANLAGDWKISITITDELTALKEVDALTEKTEYFDLTGRRVENPSAGVYIRRQGTNTQTIHIR